MFRYQHRAGAGFLCAEDMRLVAGVGQIVARMQLDRLVGQAGERPTGGDDHMLDRAQLMRLG